MNIELNFFASFKKYLPYENNGEHIRYELETETSIGGLLQTLGVPEELPKVFFVNGLAAKDDTVLKDGDRVGVFPLVAGG